MMENIFDLERYPIADSDHPLTIDLINKTKEELESIGCAFIPGFIKPQSHLRMECRSRKEIGRDSLDFKPEQSIFHQR